MVKNPKTLLEEFFEKYSEIIFWEENLNYEDKNSSDLKKYQHNEMSKKINISAYKKTKNDFYDLQYWRLNVIDMCQNIIGKKISGKCMEIGSGQGLATGYISSKKDVENVIALDYSISSLKNLMPKAHYELKGVDPSKIKRVYGSFDSIKEKNLDFVFGFGALHNSKDLFKSFKSIYDSLNENSFLISSDMCENFQTSI